MKLTCFHISRLQMTPTMNIRMPAPLNVLTTPGISSRGGSTIPRRPTRVRPVVAWRKASDANSRDDGEIPISATGRTFRARRITRFPSLDQRSFRSLTAANADASSAFTFPSTPMVLVQRSIKISGAPLTVSSLYSVSKHPATQTGRPTCHLA